MIENLIDIARQAGQITLRTYNQASLEVKLKKDRSVFTEADMQSHFFICEQLRQYYPDIPIISEESSEEVSYEERKHWSRFFLVDPLDGSKEYIQGNGEFTVNIALVEDNLPVAGVIHAPVLGVSYFAEKGKGAFKRVSDTTIKLSSATPTNITRIAISRSHCCERTKEYIEKLKAEGKEVVTVGVGSALKFGLIAEGSADIYPRFSPTMEWDTAAGQIIVNECGKEMLVVESDVENEMENDDRNDDRKTQLQYNKESLINPGFLVC